ncbi:hypothetical protein DFP72DRAFT_182737 [Ephemerocybe angulata]|uniref:Uncharacterized protein n=1 Tax=Ephemerocybe angulata TaxID=980116 RepID=A0A8H6H9M6_9AGAR|nr:hypothetical protein DFP72DRAFT_182737 [Tulosesus angulatus]
MTVESHCLCSIHFVLFSFSHERCGHLYTRNGTLWLQLALHVSRDSAFSLQGARTCPGRPQFSHRGTDHPSKRRSPSHFQSLVRNGANEGAEQPISSHSAAREPDSLALREAGESTDSPKVRNEKPSRGMGNGLGLDDVHEHRRSRKKQEGAHYVGRTSARGGGVSSHLKVAPQRTPDQRRIAQAAAGYGKRRECLASIEFLQCYWRSD